MPSPAKAEVETAAAVAIASSVLLFIVDFLFETSVYLWPIKLVWLKCVIPSRSFMYSRRWSLAELMIVAWGEQPLLLQNDLFASSE